MKEISPRYRKNARFGLSVQEHTLLAGLHSPIKVQDFLDSLPINFETKGETYMSVSRVLRAGTAHCFEGALVAAFCFYLQGSRPLLLDFKTDRDEDHVVAPFKEGNLWGAVSKTNHSVLRFRDPVYRSMRELALSYFHEYFRKDGTKSLRSYSRPFSLLRYDPGEWVSGDTELFHIVDDLDTSPHYPLFKKSLPKLRKTDSFVRRLSNVTEWGKDGKRKKPS